MDSYFVLLVYTCRVSCQDQDESILYAEVYYILFCYNDMCRSQSSKVDVVTGLHTRQLRNHDLTPTGVRYSLFFSKVFRLPAGSTNPFIQQFLRTISPRVKCLGYEIDHAPHSVEVKNAWSHTSLPLCTFMVYAGTFTFTFKIYVF